MRTLRILGALTLAASTPSFLSAQAPAPKPAPAQPPAHAQNEVAARRMEVHRVMSAPMRVRGAMAMAMANHGPMMDAASMLLAHTGELQLSDAQVTKLASIARRSEARQKAMHARMDSAMTKMRARAESEREGDRGDMMPAMMMRLPERMEAERKAQHEDDRDAFSVVNADQLATAFELMMRHHR